MKYDRLASKIEKHFASHGADVKLDLLEVIGDNDRLIFVVKLRKGTKLGTVFDRSEDIRMSLGLPLFQVIKEGTLIHLAISNRPIAENSLSKMLTSSVFRNSRMRIPIALGYDMRGRMFFADLVEFVHAMYGGATSSGKTVGLQSLVMSIATFQPVNRLNLIIVDTYTNKLNLFNKLPHLVLPVVKDVVQVIGVLRNLNLEMEQRLTLPIDELRLLPALVCIIDEYINLIKNIDAAQKNDLLSALTNLLRLGRQAKIHIILATQEPGKDDMQISLNNVTGRMAFTCSNYYNSISLLGSAGAEKLPGKGAMYFKAPGQDPIPLQGSEMKVDEIEKVVTNIASKQHDLSNKFDISKVEAQTSVVTEIAPYSQSPKRNDGKELSNIILWTLGQDKVSAERIKQRFHQGNRAYNTMDELYDMNIIAEKFHNQPRVVLPVSVDDVPADVLGFLENHGVSAEDVSAAIYKRKGRANLQKPQRY